MVLLLYPCQMWGALDRALGYFGSVLRAHGCELLHGYQLCPNSRVLIVHHPTIHRVHDLRKVLVLQRF